MKIWGARKGQSFAILKKSLAATPRIWPRESEGLAGEAPKGSVDISWDSKGYEREE
jgi:hypothetical protein